MFKIKDKKNFFKLFAISFAAGAVLFALLFFVIFRSIFYSSYISKGNSSMAAKDYVKAAQYYSTAKSWKSGKQEVYLLLADAYSKAEMYTEAGAVIDEAISKKLTTDVTDMEQLYTLRISMFSSAGDLSGAADYTDSITDQYILKSIQKKRPADLFYTPTQGSYDKTLKMTITVPEGLTVYYTTDGTAPTKASNIYVNPISIGTGETKVSAIALNSEGLVSPILSVTYTVTNENATVSFDDPKIEKMVRASLSKPVGIIRLKELEGVTELNNGVIDGHVKTLSDLELMPNLEVLHLDGETDMVSISQISGRVKLKTLSVSGCNLSTSDISAFENLTELTTLDISNNKITSLQPLSKLTKLEFVYLAQNRIDDISVLANAEKITFIDASENNLTSVPDLTKVSNLKTLLLAKNRISDMSTIHRFTELTFLDISYNAIKSAKNISALVKLETLNISGNGVSDFDFLKSLKSLTDLNVSATSFVSAKPISGLKLTYFYANDTGLVSIDELASMKELISLGIANTNVTSIAPISNFAKLDYIDISGCKLTDISVLSTLPALSTVTAKGVDIGKVNFKNKNISIVTK